MERGRRGGGQRQAEHEGGEQRAAPGGGRHQPECSRVKAVTQSSTKRDMDGARPSKLSGA